MAKKCKCECKKGLPLWLGTFGDLMSLLLTFFVLLLSMATFDKKRVELALGSLDGAFSVLESGEKSEVKPPKPVYATPMETDTETIESQNVFANLITEFNEMNKVAFGPSVKLEEAEDGFVVRIPNSLLFEKGAAEITNPDAFLFLKRISLEINKLPNGIHIMSAGHTDNTPLGENGRFVDNWELSAARALNVVRELQNNMVDPVRMAACGQGEYLPVSTNATTEGRAQNRRVDLHFFSTKSKHTDEAIAEAQRLSNDN